MDMLFLSISLSMLSIFLASSFLLRPPRQNLPPTPFFSLPIIGHLHLIKHPLHRILHNLSKTYGDIFSLRFGSRLVVVVSSPSLVQECFTMNDIVLANRPLLGTGKHLAYNHTTMAVAPYGDHWRNLRRIGALEIFSTSRLNLFMGIREDEVKCLMLRLRGSSSEEFTLVEPETMFLDLMYNVIMRMVAGNKPYEHDKGRSREFRELVTKIMAVGGTTNPGDFIPILNWIDPTGLEKKIMKLGQKMDELLQELVDGIRYQKGAGNTMIHRLLHLQKNEPQNHTDQIIKGLIQIILIAGIDTTAVTLEWALSHLLNNPEVLEKAKAEIDSSIGQERLVNEADLSGLNYLQGIVSETLRLTPAAPLLVPHCASKDTKIGGYDIPRDTIVLINAWAIHRDPSLWEDATRFKPERHASPIGIDSYKLLPFGLGRRACPGIGIAQRMATLTLGRLIQCFEWEREGSSLVDMSEGEGVTMPKAQRLVAKCKPRPIMKTIFNEAVHPNI
ncbi:cytochrome P450 81D11-like [Cucurbita pepo subsp. pepo]|uniref:cytochrome P450 81D11-like n=1 Tax=Cucurbita pepo subsp. pepo TaxID=3664 RepID=UPI000C9D4503|nr:cytochrome P450 81D11-like [Cucurbita pepo subsp. pepo]